MKSNIYNQFKTDSSAEQAGVWIYFGDEADKSTPAFKIARQSKSNKKWKQAIRKYTRPHKRSIELETMDEKTAESISLAVFVDSILLDWRNVENEKGETLPFNKENATKLLKDLPDLYDTLDEESKKAGLFKESLLEEEAKN